MAQDRLQKLELTWIGKDEQREPLEPRILIEDAKFSYGDRGDGSGEQSHAGNMLIQGDNLLALKALEQDYAGRVKCIYIDPPYNTGNAFEHYDDGVEHSIWLSLMSERLKLLHKLLAKDGSIWISIDADESHYLKVLCDEIFGRRNFVDEVIWQRSFSPINLKKTLSRSHDAILVYAKNIEGFELNKLPRGGADDRYKNPDNDPRGAWTSGDLSVGPAVEKNIYPIISPSGRVCYPPDGYSWRLSEDRFIEYVADNRIWFGKDGSNVPRIKRFVSEVKDGITAMTLWTYQEVGHNQDAKKEAKVFNSDSIFDTPKPERLIERVLTLGSNSGDLVLDSFLGSGTTAAVAHKMGRKWIGVEMGEHAKTHCVPRLKQVIDGTDQGGISKAQNWKGGGGFRFYNLAPSLLNTDRFGNLVINKEYNADMLAAAMAKQEGFSYSPDSGIYWKQGRSSETDYIYTTTQFLTVEMLNSIKAEMAEGETLMICAKTFESGCKGKFAGITIKKIPQMLLGRCEFNHDDYSLNIINMPALETEDEYLEEELELRENTNTAPTLFD